MSYGNVTPLNELPDLEDLERGGHNPNHNPNMNFRNQGDRPSDEEKFQKYLRNPHKPQIEAGMSNNGSIGMMTDMIPSNMNQAEYYARQGGNQVQQMQSQMQMPTHQVERFTQPFGNCIDIARHIQDCPICSKFYSSDKTIYIIVIVILAIVTLLLLKRVLNV